MAYFRVLSHHLPEMTNIMNHLNQDKAASKPRFKPGLRPPPPTQPNRNVCYSLQCNFQFMSPAEGGTLVYYGLCTLCTK
jgi:hypothetical protein